jgi:hypothetical protein
MGGVTCAFSATEHRFRKSTADGRRQSRHRHRLLASSSACTTGRCSNSCSNGLRRGTTGAGRPRRSGLAVSGHRRRIRDLKSGSQGQRATRRARLGPQPPRRSPARFSDGTKPSAPASRSSGPCCGPRTATHRPRRVRQTTLAPRPQPARSRSGHRGGVSRGCSGRTCPAAGPAGSPASVPAPAEFRHDRRCTPRCSWPVLPGGGGPDRRLLLRRTRPDRTVEGHRA